MFGSVGRPVQDVDHLFGLLSRRMDFIEYTVLPRVQSDFVQIRSDLKTQTSEVPILSNKVSVLQAKTQGLVERVNKHLPSLGSGEVFGVPKVDAAKQAVATQTEGSTAEALASQAEEVVTYTMPSPTTPPLAMIPATVKITVATSTCTSS